LSLPREITYDSALGQLCFSPLEEQQSLRIAPLIDLQNTTDIPNNGTLLLGDFNRSTFELEVVFTLPEGDAKFGVVLGARQNSARSGGGLQYSRAEGTSSSSSSSSSASWHDKTEQATGQLFYVDYKQGGIVTVGSESAAGSFGSQVLQVAAAETQIRLQLFADGSVVEAYWQGGRVVMTSNVGGSLGSTLGSVGVSSTPSTSSMPVSAVRLEKMTAWGVGSIWVSPEEVLHAAGLRR
jgi:sucrose-6-phosphate hydrolase SacC (GH32 family)